jgi:hypothetical protein
MSLLKTALGLVASAYVKDAVMKPKQMGRVVRAYCDRARKPLLLVHGDALVHRVLGAPVKAEVVTTRAYPIAAPAKSFGAVLVVGTLERLKRPDRALTEWHRVADKVFVVVPSWWSPHTWLDPRHRWFIDPSLKLAAPLWTSVDGTHLLVVSDSSYGASRCSPSPLTSRSGTNPKRSPSPSPTHPSTALPADTDPLQFVTSPDSAPGTADPYGEMPGLLPALSSGPPASELGSEPSESWNSVSSLTVVSTPESSES